MKVTTEVARKSSAARGRFQQRWWGTPRQDTYGFKSAQRKVIWRVAIAGKFNDAEPPCPQKSNFQSIPFLEPIRWRKVCQM